jgi:NAD+ synthase
LQHEKIVKHIVGWLSSYSESSKTTGYVIGISGGIDSALTSTLCALTGKKTILLNLPIRQTSAEYSRAKEHIDQLQDRFEHVTSLEINLTETFEQLEKTLPQETVAHHLAMANTRSRLRMATLYAVAQTHHCLVAGTGNKIEDFGVGFYTKYGDGGVDLSPIADLMKSEVFGLAQFLNVVNSIQQAKPTDGLWEDGRSDEDQLGATYPELEWAMEFNGDELTLSPRQIEVLSIYRKLHLQNKHKMDPIPVCAIPKEWK